jgi:RNA polymerase sigma-70 factor, ECF subfamily
MHEAFAAALETWPQTGLPDKPRPWLISAGRFKAIDVMRRRTRFDAAQSDIALQFEARANVAPQEEEMEMIVFVSSSRAAILRCHRKGRLR